MGRIVHLNWRSKYASSRDKLKINHQRGVFRTCRARDVNVFSFVKREIQRLCAISERNRDPREIVEN
jgi:hypothetical protein